MVILLVNSSHSCNCRWPGGATDNNTYALQAVKEREVLAVLVPCFLKLSSEVYWKLCYKLESWSPVMFKIETVFMQDT